MAKMGLTSTRPEAPIRFGPGTYFPMTATHVRLRAFSIAQEIPHSSFRALIRGKPTCEKPVDEPLGQTELANGRDWYGVPVIYCSNCSIMNSCWEMMALTTSPMEITPIT